MPAEPTLYAYLHPDFVPYSQACLHVSDLAIQRGYGVFDFLKVQAGRPLFLDQYLDRLYHSAQLLELPVPLPRPALVAAVQALIGRNRHLALSGVKLLLTGGYSANGYAPGVPNLLLVQQPLELPAPAQVGAGIRMISHDYVRELPAAKTIHYTMGIRLLKQLQASGADEVLYHHGGVVSESPRANFFLVRADDTVVTPAADVLAGITRQNLLELPAPPYPVRTGTVTLDDVRQAKEAFLTSTTKRILPVVQLDGVRIGNGQPGPVTRALLAELLRLEEQEEQRG